MLLKFGFLDGILNYGKEKCIDAIGEWASTQIDDEIN